MDHVYAHIIEDKPKGKKLGAVKLLAVPMPGAEIRWSDETYFEVTRVVYCMDERTPDFNQRVNIGVKLLEDS